MFSQKSFKGDEERELPIILQQPVKFFAHVWLLTGGGEEPSLASLSAEERLRAERFGSAQKRRRYCRARVWLRSLLSRYTGVAAHDLRFTAGSFGRPELENERDLRFNLSHAGGVTACIVTRGSLCGIDIEEIAERRYDPHLAARVLAPNERADLERTPLHLRTERFLEYWTLKEAYAKAEGRGLAIAFDTVAFHRVANGGGRFAAALEDHRAWRFCCRRLLPGYVLALALKGV